MTTDMVSRIDPVQGCAGEPAAAGVARPAGGESPAFLVLLESLQKLANGQKQAAKVHDADDLRAAIRVADDGFVTAMDLRKQLETAFRSRTP